ncbi:MAG: hypothetical protein SGJ05_07080 [bacterium]|nr:hypothetical protein [bacterium]
MSAIVVGPLVFFLLTSGPLLSAQSAAIASWDSVKAGERLIPQTPTQTKRVVRPTRIYGDLYGTFGRHASEFFEDYRRYLGGPASTFDAPLGVGAGVSSFQIPDIGLGLKVSYSRSVVRETYQFTSALDRTRPDQTTSQNMIVSVVPVMATIDYIPIDRQFSTYIGAMAGIAFTSIRWNEGLSTTTLPGARQSGERYDDSHVSPAVGARAGVNLGWDSRPDAKVRPALYIEASYTFIPVSAPLFEEVAKTLHGSPARLREPYTIQAGGFGLHLGISLLVH